MTADEMLGKLGYEFDSENSGKLMYYENVKINARMIFWIEHKTVEIFWTTWDKIVGIGGVPIDMPLLKAINLKCKELGWIE